MHFDLNSILANYNKFTVYSWLLNAVQSIYYTVTYILYILLQARPGVAGCHSYSLFDVFWFCFHGLLVCLSLLHVFSFLCSKLTWTLLCQFFYCLLKFLIYFELLLCSYSFSWNNRDRTTDLLKMEIAAINVTPRSYHG